MPDHEARFGEIEALLDSANLWYNPQTGRFEAAGGAEAENNLDHDAESILGLLEGVTEEELGAYMKWAGEKADEKYYEEEAERLLAEHEKDQEDQPPAQTP